jgi:cold shock CspA family protein/ribosome-associated translation inhibitor RaiA
MLPRIIPHSAIAPGLTPHRNVSTDAGLPWQGHCSLDSARPDDDLSACELIMINPVRIAFHNLEPSESLEQAIRDRAADLDRYHPQIIGCRVLVDVPHRHRERGRHVKVRVELSLPGEDVVVSHEPTLYPALKDAEGEALHKAEDVEAVHKHAAVAIHEAFDAARRGLQDVIRRQRGDVKAHEPPGHGHVASLASDHGFIETADGREVYFHQASVLDGHFADLTVGSDVAFVEERGDKGPQASTVRLLGSHHYVP